MSHLTSLYLISPTNVRRYRNRHPRDESIASAHCIAQWYHRAMQHRSKSCIANGVALIHGLIVLLLLVGWSFSGPWYEIYSVMLTGTLVSVDQYLNVKLSSVNVVDTDRYPQLVSLFATALFYVYMI